MNPFFSSPERLAALRAEARSWIGTPFAAHAMIKGAGADCVHLVAGIYLATGVLQTFAPPDYALDGNKDQLTTWLDADPRFQRISPGSATVPPDCPGSATVPVAVSGVAPETPLAGDVLCFYFRAPGFHAGLMLDHGDFIHVLPKRFVIISNLRESFYARQIVAVFRPLDITCSRNLQVASPL